MAKRTWITVKRGILEPKHRFELGELIYLFLYILDLTNWESGVIEDWLDRGAAEELEMPLATLRDQRRKLEMKGYITTVSKQHGIRLIVHNWTNPREYSGKKYNEKIPGDTPGDTPSYIPSDTPSDTPSFNDTRETPHSSYSQKSKITNHKSQYSGGVPVLSPIQESLEKITGLPPTSADDVKAMDEIAEMNPLQADIEAAFGWVQAQGHRIHHYRSMVNPIRVSIAKRVQKPQTTLDKSKAAVMAVLAEMEEVEA